MGKPPQGESWYMTTRRVVGVVTGGAEGGQGRLPQWAEIAKEAKAEAQSELPPIRIASAHHHRIAFQRETVEPDTEEQDPHAAASIIADRNCL
eukprot:scaffold53943_cov65-Phaeocystis_antarctica.AAC.1